MPTSRSCATISSVVSSTRKPGIDSSLSSVPPVCPSPRPLIFPNGTPQAATIGPTAIDVLSPTPPVECLSTTFRPSAAPRSSVSPERIIASVSANVSAAGQALEVDGHAPRGHLVVGHLVARVREDELGELVGGELLAVALPLDQVGRAHHAALLPDLAPARGTSGRRSGDARHDRCTAASRRAAPSARARRSTRCLWAIDEPTYPRTPSASNSIGLTTSLRLTRRSGAGAAPLRPPRRSARASVVLSRPTSAHSSSRCRSLFVAATSLPAGRSTRASSRDREVDVGRVVQHPVRDDAVEAVRRKGSAQTSATSASTPRSAPARPSAARCRRRRRSRVSSSRIRSANAPHPHPTSRTRAGPHLRDRLERHLTRVGASQRPGRRPRAPRAQPRSRTRRERRRGRRGSRLDDRRPGAPLPGCFAPSHAHTVAPTSPNSPFSWIRPAALRPAAYASSSACSREWSVDGVVGSHP